MRPAWTRLVAASLAALLVGASTTASEAQYRWGGGGWHGGGWGWRGGGWHGGGWGGWGWGPFVGGLAAGAILGSVVTAPYRYGYYGYNSCYQYRPVYSRNGVYLGSQVVNVCY